MDAAAYAALAPAAPSQPRRNAVLQHHPHRRAAVWPLTDRTPLSSPSSPEDGGGGGSTPHFAGRACSPTMRGRKTDARMVWSARRAARGGDNAASAAVVPAGCGRVDVSGRGREAAGGRLLQDVRRCPSSTRTHTAAGRAESLPLRPRGITLLRSLLPVRPWVCVCLPE